MVSFCIGVVNFMAHLFLPKFQTSAFKTGVYCGKPNAGLFLLQFNSQKYLILIKRPEKEQVKREGKH